MLSNMVEEKEYFELNSGNIDDIITEEEIKAIGIINKIQHEIVKYTECLGSDWVEFLFSKNYCMVEDGSYG